MTIPPETVRVILLDLAGAVFAGTLAAYLIIRLIDYLVPRTGKH